jgi:ankyrin repeat protein
MEIRGQFSKTAIIWAEEISQSSSVRSLISHRADVNAQDQFGETALHYASANGHAKVGRALVSKGAKVRIANARLRHPVDGAASEFGGVYSTAKILLDYGANPNHKDEAGCTLLHYAAQTGNERLVRLQVDHGAGWRAKNRNGELAVDFAEKNGHFDVARVLREDRDSTTTQPSFEQLRMSRTDQ